MTTKTVEIPKGIDSFPHTCRMLVYANGVVVDTGDVIPHFKTEEKAAEEAAWYTAPEWGTPTPVQPDGPCFEALARCGHVLDEDDLASHHPSAEEALSAAKDADWLVREGVLWCSPDCDAHPIVEG
jgi:hypothetical protein